MNKVKYFLISALLLLSVSACNNKSSINSATTPNIEEPKADKVVPSAKINVNFSVGDRTTENTDVIEDSTILKALNRNHSVKYYSYKPSPVDTLGNLKYHDIIGNERIMIVDDDVDKNTYKWLDGESVLTKNAPLNHDMSYGIDISKHNGNVDFIKIKNAGFDFVFIRVAYRRYGKQGKLAIDEMQSQNIKLAINAGLKVGAYVFSQAVSEEEAIEEAKLAIDLVKDYEITLPIAFNAETIKNDVARTDNIEGEQFTKNAIAFCEEIKKANLQPVIYANLVWEDYYYDMEKLKDYQIWYSDYNEIPQTPYNFKYWQFSNVGIVDGVEGFVDLNVMIDP